MSYGHGHGQEHEHEHKSSVASPIGSSPIARTESTTILNDTVVTTTTTTTTTTTNIALDFQPHNIDDALFDIPTPEFHESRRPQPHAHGHNHDHDHTINLELTDAPYSPSTGFATGGSKLASERSDGLMTNPPVHDTGSWRRSCPRQDQLPS